MNLFEQVIMEWLEKHCLENSRSTAVKYRQVAKKYLLPYFKNIKSRDISYALLTDYHYKIKKENICLSISTQRIIFMILNNSLQYALINQYINKKIYIRPHLKKEKAIVQIFSDMELSRLEKYLFNSFDRFSAAVLSALYSGLRIGELCGLKWDDICLEKGTLQVQRTIHRLPAENQSVSRQAKTELVVSAPKSPASTRIVPIPSFLVKYLMHFQGNNQRGFVFSHDPANPLDPRTLQYRYQKILKKCDIPYIKFHCLRHTYATRCIVSGCDIKTLSELLGHTDIKLTMDYYFHSSFEYKQIQVNKLKPIS